MKNRKAIWYIHPYAGGPGVGRYDRAYHLCRYFQKRGHPSLIIAPSYHHLMDAEQRPGDTRVEGVDYHFMWSPPYHGNGLGRLINMFFFAKMLARRLEALTHRHGKPGLVIASSPHPYVWPAISDIGRQFGAQRVFEVRDIWPQSLVDLGGLSPRHPFVRYTESIELKAYRDADAIVSLLPLTQTYMARRGLDPHRWHHIPNGVEVSNIHAPETPSACLDLARQWRASGFHVVVYAGAMGKPNGVESLLRALAVAGDRAHNVRVIIVGRGESEAVLRNMATAPDIANRAAVFGQISKAATLSLLRCASAGYMSLIEEPVFSFGISPNKLYDYMLTGIPVVAAINAGNNPVNDARCGVCAEPNDPQSIADALCHLFSLTEEERREMGSRGRDYVLEHHTYEHLADEYLKLMATSS